MLRLVLILLAIWLVLAILGAVVRGLIWLTVLAAVLFVVTAAWGWWQRQRGSTR
ncbi:hypothetical protein ACFPZ0_24910 [Streptomonospora nanhaiensis]|uniref:Uncharacterized protein n=1 Tax=Streptomonospora nanhaiensis TaxID=1323731 RepID=A0A853BMK7_9ACTN|nr:hypothetical protein [Streptomonospora nanhaiensis]MBV2365787.1 hypothetical protein [Streptomonospora nanhaiensis]MBX9391369.1 hypothetical protein [Streptomonospora nanhaiensis]NYI96453.1 hypothetical protein [Streptomonospora nanhaiensis]